MATEWHYTSGGQKHGPVDSAELRNLALGGFLGPDDFVWKNGLSEWVQASNVKGLFDHLGRKPLKRTATPIPDDPTATAEPQQSSATESQPNSANPVFSMVGVGELLAVYDDRIAITPKGVLGFFSRGLAGTKEIYFASIVAIQFKEAGRFVSGYIQFTIPGGNESKGGVFSAAGDENTFMFAGNDNNTLARTIKEYVNNALRTLRTPQASSPTATLSNELRKLAELKEQGLLTEDEFNAAKRKLIG